MRLNEDQAKRVRQSAWAATLSWLESSSKTELCEVMGGSIPDDVLDLITETEQTEPDKAVVIKAVREVLGHELL